MTCKYYALPVCWEMVGTIYIKANSAVEAIDKFYKNTDKIDLPTDIEAYSEGSFDLCTSEADYIDFHTETKEKQNFPGFGYNSYDDDNFKK